MEPQVHDFAQVIIFSYATVTGVMLFRVVYQQLYSSPHSASNTFQQVFLVMTIGQLLVIAANFGQCPPATEVGVACALKTKYFVYLVFFAFTWILAKFRQEYWVTCFCLAGIIVIVIQAVQWRRDGNIYWVLAFLLASFVAGAWITVRALYHKVKWDAQETIRGDAKEFREAWNTQAGAPLVPNGTRTREAMVPNGTQEECQTLASSSSQVNSHGARPAHLIITMI